MKRILLALAFNVAMQTLGNAQTAPTSLQVTTYSNITSASTLDGAGYIDNRSTFIRANNYHGFNATGTGTWSVTMQYADGTPSGWVSFGPTAVLSGNNSPLGYGIGYHDYIRFLFSGTATVATYSASKNFWYPTFPVANNTCYWGGVFLTGCSYPAARGYNLAVGTTDIYTVPAGKRALVTGIGGYNPSAGTVAWTTEIKSSGNYFPVATVISTNTHVSTSVNSVEIVLEAGESLSILAATTAGLNLQAIIVQFDNTSQLRTVKLLGLSTGDNALYTAPAGKTAVALSGPGINWNNTTLVAFTADSGGTRVANVCSVAFGGATTCAANSVNEIGSASVAPSARASLAPAGITMNAGDFLVVNVDTGAATQIAWINVLEQ